MIVKNKINWLLILQGWAMLWVVIGHSSLGLAGQGPAWENALFNFAYSFHMPLFILVSGWLFYRTRLNVKCFWSYGRIIKDKAKRLLLPGLFFSVLAIIMKMVFPNEVSRQMGQSFHEITHIFLYPYDNPLRELWFIVTLFWLFLLTPIWRCLLNDLWLIWIGGGLLCVLHFYHPRIEFLCLDRVAIYGVYFYLGLILSKEDFIERCFAKWPWIMLLAGIAIYMVGYLIHPFIRTIGGISLSLGLSLIADKKISWLFFTFRNYTYQIFLMGIFAQMIVKIAYKHVPSIMYFEAYLLCILMGLYIPVLLSKIIERINWEPLSLCVGLKKKNY